MVLKTEDEVIDFLESFDGYGLATVDHEELRERMRDIYEFSREETNPAHGREFQEV